MNIFIRLKRKLFGWLKYYRNECVTKKILNGIRDTDIEEYIYNKPDSAVFYAKYAYKNKRWIKAEPYILQSNDAYYINSYIQNNIYNDRFLVHFLVYSYKLQDSVYISKDNISVFTHTFHSSRLGRPI